MKRTLLKLFKKHLGAHLTALLVGLAVFMLPKIIKDDYEAYREIKQAIWKHIK